MSRQIDRFTAEYCINFKPVIIAMYCIEVTRGNAADGLSYLKPVTNQCIWIFYIIYTLGDKLGIEENRNRHFWSQSQRKAVGF